MIRLIMLRARYLCGISEDGPHTQREGRVILSTQVEGDGVTTCGFLIVMNLGNLYTWNLTLTTA